MIRDRASWKDTSSKGGSIAGLASVNSGVQTTQGHITAAAGTTARLLPNLLQTAPYFVSASETIDSVVLDMTVAGSVALVGLYHVGCAMQPLPSVLFAATQPMSITGTGTRQSSFFAQLHDRTLWWFAVLVPSSAGVEAYQTAYTWPLFGHGADLTTAYGSVVASWAYASGLPAVFPTSVTYVSSAQPLVGVSLRSRG